MIEIVTALIRDKQGRVLLVRKNGTASFMQPGGKREANESDLMALAREIREELGCTVVPDSIRFLGTFEAAAANEPGQWVRASAYKVRVTGRIACEAEIAEIIWVDPRKPCERNLAPLMRDIILPLALSLED
ncbi:NUDIX hydrolase [Microvirga sp. KLBC 81]|uniref:NUDIX hydrolase n=1 Tax=Microvirga sp. KLBC 81 TaxID=1862707 RepID=UPI000D51D324|nr:NUDIX domain-containing protein [Microvirga sp. KLBC 81]PVE26010.1 NUDIX hydrolase [Microvirga sp. KLBC 81]